MYSTEYMNLFHLQIFNSFVSNRDVFSQSQGGCSKDLRISRVAPQGKSLRNAVCGPLQCRVMCRACAKVLSVKTLLSVLYSGSLCLGPQDTEVSALDPEVQWHQGVHVPRSCSSVNGISMFPQKDGHPRTPCFSQTPLVSPQRGVLSRDSLGYGPGPGPPAQWAGPHLHNHMFCPSWSFLF